MNRLCLAIFVLVLTLKVSGQPNESVKLALVSETDEVSPAADLLTAQLSSNTNLQLLERNEIEKVYREQGLSAGSTDYLKLGQILGADGLLLLGTASEGADRYINIRLVAVKPGVVLLDQSFPWPLKDLSGWTTAFANQVNAPWPKLKVLVKDAIPISIVNLRSALSSDEALETERQLKLLAIQRLSREPQIFVLERQKLQNLAEEKDLRLDDSPFWGGSYLLEGVVDQNSFSRETITINARLTPPKGGAALQFEISGARTNLAEVVNLLAVKVDEALKVKAMIKEWNAADEAQQYIAEANWAMRWGIYPEAQMAAESAWALGVHNPETDTLRIRAYSQSVPLQGPYETQPAEGLPGTEIVVLAIPDARRIEVLRRAMELFDEDARYVLGDTNDISEQGFVVGLQLLRRTAGVLESYYYAAEMRDGKAEELSALRAKMRLMLAKMDTYVSPGADGSLASENPQTNYQWLKWEEGGLCYDRPEDALPMLRQLLESGYDPKHLPRVVGWSWEQRKRIPDLMQQFVNGICAETNPTVKLQGLYLATLQAPNDENHSFQIREDELLSSIWDNRQWLFSSAKNVSMLDYVQAAQQAKFQDPSSLDYYDREPFASFKHRLRMDFLQQSSSTNLAVFQALFPATNVRMETPDQARELLRLALNYQQQLHSPPALNRLIKHLRETAGVADASPNPASPASLTVPAGKVTEAKFIKWNLLRPGIDSDRSPRASGMVLRNGKLWMRIRYFAKHDMPFDIQSDFQTTYLCVDPRGGAEQEIRFPDRFGQTDDGFEVSADSLFVNAQGYLYRYPFQGQTWEEIPSPLDGSSQLVWLQGNLFVSRSDGLLKFNPVSNEVRVLVSSRRQPAVNEIDPLWVPSTLIFARSDGKLGALSREHSFDFDPATGRWNIRTLPVAGTNDYFGFWTLFTSAAGGQQFLTGAVAHRYLVGYWNNDGPPESLLMEVSQFKTKDPVAEKTLQPIRWDWPSGFPLEPSSILATKKTLWVLCPCKFWQSSLAPYADEPVRFLDNRQATLFFFEPNRRQPSAAAIRFEDNGATNPKINDHILDMLHPLSGGFSGNWEKLANHVGNAVFWLKTPAGLVYGAPTGGGHWFISDAALNTCLQPPPPFPDSAADTSTNISRP